MASKFDVDEKALRKLAQILAETGLSEIEYQSGEHRIRVARHLAPAAAAVPVAAAAPAAAPAAAEATPARSAAPAPGTVTSPMVGTAYSAAEPGKPPFVRVGDRVREGQTLLIIEAMKVMNTLPSPRAGTVTQILFEDGQPVEYGEPLLVIE